MGKVTDLFTVTGIAPNAMKQTFTWDNGQFSSEHGDMAEFLDFSAELEFVHIANMCMKNDHADPLAASALLNEYFMGPQITEMTGDVPKIPSVPPGAIA